MRGFCSHFLSFYSIQSLTAAVAAAKSLQSCPTLCDPIDGSPPGSSVHGIFQAGVLEFGAINFSLLNTIISTWKQCWFCKSNQWSHHCLGILRILSSSLCLVNEIHRDNGNMSTEIYFNMFVLHHSKISLRIWNFQWTLSGGNSARPNVSTRQVCCVYSWALWVLTAPEGHLFP